MFKGQFICSKFWRPTYLICDKFKFRLFKKSSDTANKSIVLSVYQTIAQLYLKLEAMSKKLSQHP